MSLALLGFAPSLRRERRRRKDPAFRTLGEGFMKDISTILLASVFVLFSLIVLILSSQHSGSYEFDIGQRPAKSLRSWTAFRLQKIGLH
jgi:hypothetical protein